jgi:uncharacterized membrane protein YphA (DoxX/SURF4 family)
MSKLLDIEGSARTIAQFVAIPASLSEIASQVEEAVKIPVHHLLAILLGVVEVLAGLLIAFNVLTRLSAVVLLAFAVVTVFFFYDFWNQPEGISRTNMMVHALENLSIIGGLLILVALPRRHWALERESLDQRSLAIQEGEFRS